MKVPRFDVFSGTHDDAQWIEVVEGLDTASIRMEFYAAKCPGKYFIFDCSEHEIAASIDTSSPITSSSEDMRDGGKTLPLRRSLGPICRPNSTGVNPTRSADYIQARLPAICRPGNRKGRPGHPVAPVDY